MAYIENTRFEAYVSDGIRNGTQNITGKFGSFSGQNFTPDACSAGFLCVKSGELPNEGYESLISMGTNGSTGHATGAFAAATGLKNGNSYYMVAATNGKVAGYTGDHTGIYFCNPYDVNKAQLAGVGSVNIAGTTLGIPVPANERGDFTEAIVGEKYNVGAGNFGTLPSTSATFAVIANGKLTAQAAAPADGSVYFKIVDTSRYSEGGYDGGAKYTLQCLRGASA